MQKYFFQFSKNGRRDKTTNKKKRNWAKQNNSTMNRISRAFDDIGNINMNWAGIKPFNWQMLMSGPCYGSRHDITNEFCNLDDVKRSLDIRDCAESPAEKELEDNNTVLDEHVIHNLCEKFGSLEFCYPYIVKFLFTGEMAEKPSHKKTFWRVFGDIALKNLRENLANCTDCEICGAKVPNWAGDTHMCPKNTQGYFTCIDCGKICEKTNSRQERCTQCQLDHRNELRRKNRKLKKEKGGEKESTTLSAYQFGAK